MEFSVMTFNMDFNKGLKKVSQLTRKYKPDILCLQEIDTSSENLAVVEALGYELCDYANSRVKWNNIYGVATFFAQEKIVLIKSDSINLPSGLVEIIEFLLNAGRRQRTVLKTQFDVMGKRLSVINIHLSPYATNNLREKQMHETFQHLNLGNEATVVLGDFNYPYHRSKFEEIFKHYSLSEATNKIFSTFKSSIPFFPFNFKLDYVLFKGITHISTERIEEQYSDHKPVLSRFEL